MIIKSETKSLKKKSNFFKNFLTIYFIFSLSIAVLFSIFFFTSYTIKSKTFKILDYISKAGRIEYIHIFDIAYDALKSNFYKLDKIDLEIKFEDIVILESERSKAIKNSSLGLKDNLTKVNAIIKYKDKKIKGRIRLKGDRIIHFAKKNHSSYNIYLPKDKFIKGVNNFSIQKPGVRNYIHEWIFIEMMDDLGLIKPKYEFFNLYINGTNNGLYVLEEKMSKEIIERNKRRNGPILSILGEFERPFENKIFQVYNEKFWTRPENIEIAQIAKKKISDFLKGKRKIEDTFDVEKFAAFFAVLDLTYTTHALFFSSKLYYNPINGLFEPIPRDGHRQLPNYHKFNQNYYDKIIIDSIYKPEEFSELGGNLQIPAGRQWWIKKFFTNQSGELNENFYKLYIKYLTKISSEEYINSFLNSRANKIKKINSHIYSDYFFYSTSRGYTWGLYYFDKNDLYHRANVIKKRLKTEEKKISAIIYDDKTLEIDVAYPYSNSKINNAKLDDLTLKNIICDTKENKDTKILINKPLNIFSNTKFNLALFGEEKINCTYANIIDYKLNKIYNVQIDKLNSHISFKNFKIYKKEKLDKYFIEKKDKIYLKSKNIIIKENLYIPKNKIVIINAGQSITLINNAFIISDSAWLVKGSKDLPITITGEKNNFGGGILISDKKNKSFFNNVKFSYLKGYQTNSEFIITGAINFYKTDALLTNVAFNKTISEDALNIVSSKFNIKNIEFNESMSDSIDLDFSNGTMYKAKFTNIGNDAIDFAESNVEASNIYFDQVGDKLISIGENSNIKISNIKAQKSYVGIASKDGSIVTASNILMKNVKLPFLSFNKKFEYKPSTLYLTNIDVSEFYEKWVTDKNSKIFFNDSKVGIISKNIIPVVYEKNLQLLK